ncbi:MAG TPA: phosphoglycolate phosphatase [Steroidobacteraceae bacterium]|nr:phosphoglycolate phosphatase [Steroidobacteraceae bacterium]
MADLKHGQAARERRAAAEWRGRSLAAVLFDLDGTLLDTAADIALALNRAIGEYGWTPIAPAEVRALIGRGAPMLLRRAAALQGRHPDEALLAAMLEGFLRHYGALEERRESAAQPFAGAAEALRQLHGAGLKIAVVTNKQQRFADSLLGNLGLAGWIDLVVGGDACARRKPDPEPLLYACARLGAAPQEALMVGDSGNDVQAARAAQIPVVCVPYGYNEGRDARELPCDALIESLADLPAMLLPAAAPRR